MKALCNETCQSIFQLSRLSVISITEKQLFPILCRVIGLFIVRKLAKFDFKCIIFMFLTRRFLNENCVKSSNLFQSRSKWKYSHHYWYNNVILWVRIPISLMLLFHEGNILLSCSQLRIFNRSRKGKLTIEQSLKEFNY